MYMIVTEREKEKGEEPTTVPNYTPARLPNFFGFPSRPWYRGLPLVVIVSYSSFLLYLFRARIVL